MSELLREAWEDLLRFDPPAGAVVYGFTEDRQRPCEPSEEDRWTWYQRGSAAQRADVTGPLSRYPAHWTLDDDSVEDYGAEHTRVLSTDAMEFEEDEAELHSLYTDDDVDAWEGEPDEFLDSVAEVAELTKREREVAAWIVNGNAIVGVEYITRLAEALGCTRPAAKMAAKRLRRKLVDHWAS